MSSANARDPARLADREFDLLVVGAGIYGLTVAWDAAQRGLSVALIDRGDFAGATSFNSAKTVHGGVRSLQHGRVREMREYVRERRALTRILPHLVHPLPFLMPTYRSPERSRLVTRGYFAVNDLLSRDRNTLPDPSKHLPPSRLVSREECLRLNPAINPEGVTGGIIWYDCQMYSTDRVAFAFLQSAVRLGTAAANYVEAVSPLRRNGRITGVSARDVLTRESIDIRARLVINASGPWAVSLARTIIGAGQGLAPRLSLAMNLVTRPLAHTHALGSAAGSRLLLIAPWRDCSIVGTSHDPFSGDPSSLRVTRRDVERFLNEINDAFPRVGLGLTDVRLVHRGLLPASASDGTQVRLLKDTRVHDHRKDGVDGLVTIVGVRYTTARATAERVVDLAFSILGRPAPACRSATTPLAGGDINDFAEFEQQVLARHRSIPADTLRRLVRCYGSEYSTVLDPIAEHRDQARPLGASCPVTHAEVRHAVHHEMAVKLSDAVLRRTEAGSAGHPGSDALRAAARVMAADLGWDETRIEREVRETEAIYRIED